MNGPPDPRHLVLVGMMGSGKSTVGAACAAARAIAAVDTDDLVVLEAGRTVAEIFTTDGEAAFRALERRAVRDAIASPVPTVISCGGGAVLDPENRRVLRDHGFVVWLRATPTTLETRLGSGDPARPLLSGAPVGVTLARLLARRESAYEAAAHAVVDTDGRTVDDIVAEVLTVAYA